MIMSKLLGLLFQTYYTLPILFLIEILAVIVSFSRRKQFLELNLFHLYPLAALLQTLVSVVSILFLPTKEAVKISESSISVFSVIEVALIFQFEFQVIRVRPLRRLMQACFVGFIFAIVY